MTCNYKVVGSNSPKLTVDFTMTREKVSLSGYCLTISGFVLFIIKDIKDAMSDFWPI